ncbi:MAG TPA: multicopper oxidase domain-containing protein [Mobilitalea sp.]|nr:multicopper oxidase domain-containing protein [Mobilitalea sp.]
MTIRHYVLLATDGFIDLPTTKELCPATDTLQKTYVFGFVGGLFQVLEDDKITYEDNSLNWKDPANWNKLWAMQTTASIPSPIIWAEQGDHLYITLINLGMPVAQINDPHTIHLHGAHVATQIDGFPESSFAVPMWIGPSQMPPTATYYFLPEHPGTYMYHCHVEASEHVQMGMYGALVIYPSVESLEAASIEMDHCGHWRYKGEVQYQIPRYASHRQFAYNNIQTFFDKEYVMLLSDLDLKWHQTVQTAFQTGLAFNDADFKPNFWLVNGRAFPDTLLPHPQTPPIGSDPNVAQINYESYVHIKTDDKFLLRMINMGYAVVPWHIHGWHFTVIGKDAHPSPFLTISEMLDEMSMHSGHKHTMDMNQDMMEMGFTETIGSGETHDLLLTADNKEPLYGRYIFEGQDMIPSLCEQMSAIQAIDPALIANVPTQPVSCKNTQTVNYVSLCAKHEFFPQFYPMHNHDDYKVTNTNTLATPAFSNYPGGQLTMIQTDAPSDYMA